MTGAVAHIRINAPSGTQLLAHASPVSVVELLASRRVDLVLQDMILPDISGTDLVRRLRAVPACAKIPILALSGFASMLSVAENRLLGFTDVLSKPIEPSRLVATVRAHLSL